jgi:hypothetical protein
MKSTTNQAKKEQQPIVKGSSTNVPKAAWSYLKQLNKLYNDDRKHRVKSRYCIGKLLLTAKSSLRKLADNKGTPRDAYSRLFNHFKNTSRVESRTLHQCVQFAKEYDQAAFDILYGQKNITWTHVRKLLSVTNVKKRTRLAALVSKHGWSVSRLGDEIAGVKPGDTPSKQQMTPTPLTSGHAMQMVTTWATGLEKQVSQRLFGEKYDLVQQIAECGSAEYRFQRKQQVNHLISVLDATSQQIAEFTSELQQMKIKREASEEDDTAATKSELSAATPSVVEITTDEQQLVAP